MAGKKKNKTEKRKTKISLIAGGALTVAIVAIIVIASFVISGGFSGSRKLTDDEYMALLLTKLAATTSAVNSSGSVNNDYIDILGNIAKKTGGDWFSNLGTIATMKYNETAETEILTISDGDFCATFITNKDKENKELIEYKFEKENCRGYWVTIEKR